jgi:hypothetical protein
VNVVVLLEHQREGRREGKQSVQYPVAFSEVMTRTRRTVASLRFAYRGGEREREHDEKKTKDEITRCNSPGEG